MRLKLAPQLLMMLVLSTGAPGDDRKTNASNGLIEFICGPVGGLAVAMAINGPSFQLQRGTEPFLIKIDLGQELPLHDGQVIKLGSGSVSKCLKPWDCQFAASAEIRIDKFNEESNATGYYALHVKNETISGPFKLRWVGDRDLACY